MTILTQYIVDRINTFIRSSAVLNIPNKMMVYVEMNSADLSL